MPESGIQKNQHCDILTFEEIERIVSVFAELGVTKLRITGGEPLVRKDLLSLISKLKKIPKLKEIVLTTNGIKLKSMAKDLKEAGIDRINLSLDTLQHSKYSYITRGGNLDLVLEGLEETLKVFGKIKLNVVLIKDFNESEIADFVSMTLERKIDVRFIELMPIGDSSSWTDGKFLSNEIVLEKMKDLELVKNSYTSSPSKEYILPYAKGKVGLISPISHKFCENCNRVRLTSDGKIKSCLHSNEEVDLKKVLREKGDLSKIIYDSIYNKIQSHYLEDGCVITKNMNKIGG